MRVERKIKRKDRNIFYSEIFKSERKIETKEGKKER